MISLFEDKEGAGMEPTDRNSPEWLEWQIRRNFGGTTFETIKNSPLDKLRLLGKFVGLLIRDKEASQPRSFLVTGFVSVTVDGKSESRPINKYFEALNHDKALQAALNWKEQQVRLKHPEAKKIEIKPFSNLVVRRQERKTKIKTRRK